MTELGAEAFYKCGQLTGTITIPSEIKRISDYTFAETAIESITFKGNSISIGSNAFLKCSSLHTISFIDGVKSIGNGAFQECTALKNLQLSNTLTTIGAKAFYGCTALDSIIIPASVTTIGTEAFCNCSNLKKMTLMEGLQNIGSRAFFNASSLSRVYIPASVTSIPNGTNANNEIFKGMASNSVIYLGKNELVSLMLQSSGNPNSTVNGYTTSTTALAVTNGGTLAESTEFESDKLATPIKTGYLFGGWYENEFFSSIPVTTHKAGQTYYAKWTEKTSTSVSFKDDLDLNKIYDGNVVSLSENDYIVTESAGNVTFAYRVKDGNGWKDITSTPINAGTYQVKAIVAENDTHKRAETDWKEFIISKAMPTYEVPTNLTAIVGQTLADVTLPKGFAWQDDTTTSVGSVGTKKFKATYMPNDTTNYNTVTNIEVTLTVNPKMEELNAIPTINASDKTLTVGDKFDPLKDVTASDKEDGNITEKVEVLSNDVDTSKAGTYTVIYTVTDSNGASSTKTITVTIKEKDTQKPTTDDNKKPSATDTDKKPESTDKQTTANSPKTGDSTNMTTWLALMFVSLGLLAGVFTVRKSRRSR